MSFDMRKKLDRLFYSMFIDVEESCLLHPNHKFKYPSSSQNLPVITLFRLMLQIRKMLYISNGGGVIIKF
jgi:hypothetical protein